MLDDPCPKCGHRRKHTMASTRHEYDDLSLTDMWNGEGEPWQQSLLRAFVFIMIFILLAFIVIPNMPS